MAYSQRFYVNCTEKIDLLTITHDVKRAVRESAIKDGVAVILVPISTGGLALIENDRAIVEALRDLIVQLVPETKEARPDRRSKTGATYAHLRSLLLHPSLALPVIGGDLAIGHWQDIILYDFDDRIARREFLVQITGESGEASGGGRAAGGAGAPGGGRGGPSLPPGRAKAV